MTCTAFKSQSFAIAATARRVLAHFQRAVKISRGKCIAGKHLAGSSGKDHFAAFASGTGPDVNHVVGVEHYIFIVLYHYNRVGGIAQTLERVYQSAVVALVQSNRWLVEDIQHVHKLAAKLCSQTYALAFAARQRARVAVQLQIVEAYIDQKAQSGGYFLEYFVSNGAVAAVESLLYFKAPAMQACYIHAGQFGYVHVVDKKVQ